MTILPITWPTQDPPLWPALPPSQTRGWGRWSVRGGCSLVVKGQPRDSRRWVLAPFIGVLNIPSSHRLG